MSRIEQHCRVSVHPHFMMRFLLLLLTFVEVCIVLYLLGWYVAWACLVGPVLPIFQVQACSTNHMECPHILLSMCAGCGCIVCAPSAFNSPKQPCSPHVGDGRASLPTLPLPSAALRTGASFPIGQLCHLSAAYIAPLTCEYHPALVGPLSGNPKT